MFRGQGVAKQMAPDAKIFSPVTGAHTPPVRAWYSRMSTQASGHVAFQDPSFQPLQCPERQELRSKEWDFGPLPLPMDSQLPTLGLRKDD